MPSQRMSPGARRNQLLDVAHRVFTNNVFAEVSMEQIASEASVTRALIYHYFPTKGELFGALWERSHDELRHEFDIDSMTTVHERLVATLSAYLSFYERNIPLVLIANRSSIAASPAVREPVRATFEQLAVAALDAAHVSGESRRLAQVAYRGWVGFVRESTMAALVNETITAAENLDMCVAALDATVGAYVNLHVPASVHIEE